jgi:hypothetical protein
MKKTNQTKKLILDRQTVRELTPEELTRPSGGMATNTVERKTASCLHGCPPCVIGE